MQLPPEPTSERSRVVTAWLAIAGIVLPGLHRFYLRQRWLGGLYIILGLARFIPFLPCQIIGYLVGVVAVFEGVWLLNMDNERFDRTYNQARLSWGFREQDDTDEADAYEVLDE